MVDNSSAEFEGRGGVRDADFGRRYFLTNDYADCGGFFYPCPSGYPWFYSVRRGMAGPRCESRVLAEILD